MAEPELPDLKSLSGSTRWFWLGGIIAAFIVTWFLGGYFGATPPLIWSGILGVALVVATAIDLKHYILPDWITLPLLIVGLWVGGTFGPGFYWSGVGALIGYGLIALLRWLWLRRTGKETIGLGDAKLLGAGGAWLGAAQLPIILLIASGLALFVMLISGRAQQGQAIPFGPFLSLGIWGAWCFGTLVTV